MFVPKPHKSKLDVSSVTHFILPTVTLPDVSCLNINFGGAKILTEPLVPGRKH